MAKLKGKLMICYEKTLNKTEMQLFSIKFGELTNTYVFTATKIREIFYLFPSLRPIVSGVSFCACHLSKLVDSF